MKAVTTKVIAKALGVPMRGIRKRAEAEHWLYRKKGKVIEWEQSSLPQDVVSALASSRMESVRKTDVPAPRMGGDLLKQAREKDRQKALLKSILLSRFEQSGLRAEDFVAAYNTGSVSASLLAELGSVSVPTLYRWIADKRESGTDGLVPRYGFVKRGARSLDEITRAYLEYYWLDPRRPSIRHAYLNTCDHVGKAPSYATCKRYLENLPKPLIEYHRLGQTKFDAGNYPYIERNMSLYHAMDQLVSDHHRFDFLVEREGNLFRPWITAVQDFRSAKIVGFCPAVYPNAVTIAVAFYMAVSRYGSAKLIHIDNGKDYRCQVLNGKKGKLVVLNKDGIGEEEEVRIEGAYSVFAERVTFAKPYHGSSKGRMERTFGTFCEYFSREIPTYVGSNTVERPEDAELFFRAINKKAKRHDIYPWEDYVRA
ncbi:MAG TPA: transposase domain-containing protein, partial [Spirochaetia bacterium]|nr:transposase domain-containing protein [Spirochaetia bacterium]